MTMIAQDKRREVTFWKGTRGTFKAIRESGHLTPNRIYCVSDSDAIVDGFNSAEDGVIYIATSPTKCVRFGLFSKEENIDEKLEEIAEEIDGKASIEEHETQGGFPEVGDPNTFYVSLTDGRMYRWDGTQYVVFGGYTAGDGITIENGEIKATGVFDGVKEYVDNELEQFAETVPHLHYMTAGEVDAIFEEVFDEPYITETR